MLLLSLRLRCAALLLVACGLSQAQIVRAPYKDISIGLDASHPRIAALPPAVRQVSWGFATGECGDERWGDVDTEAFARLNVEAYRRSGVGYIVATGGEAGIFTCSSDEGMRRFAARYDSPQLLGFDFDIEGSQTPGQVRSLVQRLHVLQQRRPELRLSFTLATFAASDGSGRGLNALGEQVLAALQEARLDQAIINLMVMNYGPADAAHCVVREGRCDMGASALQAARNLQQRHGVPPRRIALTAMLGVNDVQDNVFTPADARVLADGARRLGLAGLHFWSIDRDQPCPPDAPRVSPRCHALADVPAGTFTMLLAGER